MNTARQLKFFSNEHIISSFSFCIGRRAKRSGLNTGLQPHLGQEVQGTKTQGSQRSKQQSPRHAKRRVSGCRCFVHLCPQCTVSQSQSLSLLERTKCSVGLAQSRSESPGQGPAVRGCRRNQDTELRKLELPACAKVIRSSYPSPHSAHLPL